MALNLEKQLLFYGAYHHDPVNVGIHIVCVPVLLITGFLLASNTPAIPLPDWASIPNLPLNAGVIASFLYTGLYVLMEPVAGAFIAPFTVGGAAYSNYLLSSYGNIVNWWAGGIHIAGWLLQFVGHGVYEGRAPALLDNLVQALFLAPLFVWLEVLFFFGYRPELKSRLDQAVSAELAKLNAAKKQNGHANGKAKKK